MIVSLNVRKTLDEFYEFPPSASYITQNYSNDLAHTNLNFKQNPLFQQVK